MTVARSRNNTHKFTNHHQHNQRWYWDRETKGNNITVTHLRVNNWVQFSVMLLSWAMKTAAAISYRAVPSMLTLIPIGSMRRVTLLSTMTTCSKHWKVSDTALLRDTMHSVLVPKYLYNIGSELEFQSVLRFAYKPILFIYFII